MALTTFLLEPLFHADVMLVTVLLLGLILDTRAGKSSSWKAVFFAVAVYVKDIPEEMVGAAEDDKLGKSSSLSLTAASWVELRERKSTARYTGAAEAAQLRQAERAPYLSALFLKPSLRVAQLTQLLTGCKCTQACKLCLEWVSSKKAHEPCCVVSTVLVHLTLTSKLYTHILAATACKDIILIITNFRR